MEDAVRGNRDSGAGLVRLLEERIVILDGAMATRIQTLGLGEPDYRGSHDLLSITQSELIRSIHREYLEAGADIITTNTFGANVVSMSHYGLDDQVYAINLAAAELATSVRDKMDETVHGELRFVAGAVSAPDARIETYTEQVRGLLDGGVDLLLLETVFDVRNAIAAVDAFEQGFRYQGFSIPVIASATITEEGLLPSGETLRDFWNVISSRELLAVGINCAVGPHLMEPHLKEFSDIATPFMACYPNAGLPDPSGSYLESPDDLVSVMGEFANNGWLNIAGGCCGTGPDQIRRMRETLRKNAPRRRPQALR